MGHRNRVAVVTGAARGIGRATAMALAENGADIVVGDIRFDAAQAVAQEVERLGRRSLPVAVDVADTEQITEMIDQAIDRLGGCDILINNAGISSLTPIEEMTEAEWDQVLQINLRSVFFCSQAVLPRMKAEAWGRIVNVASIAGKVGSIASGANYAAAKAGVICLTKTFAKQVGSHGITVNGVAPGFILTDMTREHYPQAVLDDVEAKVPLGRLGTPRDVAAVIAFLASEAAAYVTGETFDVDGGLY